MSTLSLLYLHNLRCDDINTMFISIQLYCCVWLRYLHWKQQRFLEGIGPQVEQEMPTVERVKREVTNLQFVKLYVKSTGM